MKNKSKENKDIKMLNYYRNLFNNYLNLTFVICHLTFILFLSLPCLATESGMDIATLKSGVGARALGMGGAFVAVSDNADSPYWNPAGLSLVKEQEITTMQTKLSSDADHYYISYAVPVLKGTLGISWVQVSLGSISQTTTTDAYNEVITTNIFNYFSNAYMLAYGLPITDNFSIGATAKYLTSDMTNVSGGQGSGYSFTPAMLLKIFKKGSQAVTVACKIDELFNEQNWGTGTSEKAIPCVRGGLSIENFFFLPQGSKLALDISQPLKRSYSSTIATGYEWLNNELALRLGYADSSVSAGAGFTSGNTTLDYAYVSSQTSLSHSNVHRLSLSGKW